MKITEIIRRNNIYFTIHFPTHTEEYIGEEILPRLEKLDNMVEESEVQRVKDLILLMSEYEK